MRSYNPFNSRDRDNARREQDEEREAAICSCCGEEAEGDLEGKICASCRKDEERAEVMRDEAREKNNQKK